ncbi:MAG: RNA methyltransferase, partial [Bacteroidota bacterium]|nr:RNA methyltransferase [Bacteroidota bacterium]
DIMISKNEVRYIRSLKQKKYRIREGRFLAEGEKLVEDLILSGWIPDQIFSTNGFEIEGIAANEISEREMDQITALENASPVLAVFKIPDPEVIGSDEDLVLAMDGIRDPGNLGTILRLADWFGVRTIICSDDTVDVFNPKVVQASMGSLARVNVIYSDLNMKLEELSSRGFSILGTFMDGNSIYDEPRYSKAVLVMGNEGQGISRSVETKIEHRVAIPRKGPTGPESLNVAMATALFLGEMRRPIV